MAIIYKGDGFSLKVCEGELRIVEKPGSKYNGKVMVVIPFSLYNIRTSTRLFTREGYKCIVRGKEVKKGVKADFGFCDSLLNLSVKPKSEVFGYIRIPFAGPGEYGVSIGTGEDKKTCKKFFANPDVDSLEFNRERYMCFEREHYFPKSQKAVSAKLKRRSNTSSGCVVHSNGLDEIDSEISKEFGRSAVFGYGRKKSREWNDEEAKKLRKELGRMRKKKKNDPNSFGHDDMK